MQPIDKPNTYYIYLHYEWNFRQIIIWSCDFLDFQSYGHIFWSFGFYLFGCPVLV